MRHIDAFCDWLLDWMTWALFKVARPKSLRQTMRGV